MTAEEHDTCINVGVLTPCYRFIDVVNPRFVNLERASGEDRSLAVPKRPRLHSARRMHLSASRRRRLKNIEFLPSLASA